MRRGGTLSQGCGTRRFATEIAALKAVERGASGVPTGHSCGGWHLREPAGVSGPDRAMREAIYERDGWACVCCGGSVIGRPRSLGHRLRASQGGLLLPSNLLTFLGLGTGQTADDHHWRIDRRIDPHDEARGFTVRSGTDPATVPVMIHGGQGRSLVYLTGDFGYTTTAPEVAA